VRILIVDTCYPSFLASHYAAHPGLEQESYDVQWRALMDTHFGTADAYSFNLARLGHTAHEVIANCAPLQEAWLRANPARISRRLPTLLRQQEVVLAQARTFEPDVIYVQNLGWVLEPTLLRLRRRTRLLAGQIASEAPRERKLRRYDLILTSFPHFVERFRSSGIRSEYLRIAFDDRVLAALRSDDASYPTRGAVFIGALNRTQHQGGNSLLAEAVARAPIEVWGYALDGWPADSPLRRGYRGEAWGLDMYRLLHSAKISINRHIEVAGDYANNMRLFESTGVGAMLLTDAKRNLDELFEPGKEVVAYDGVDDLVAKVNYYLEHDGERAAIAEAGQKRTLTEHTYSSRMPELVEILESLVRAREQR
jgi:hypothetical protein